MSPAARAAAPPVPAPTAARVPWVSTVGAGVAVLLAGAPISAVVQGGSWLGHAAVVVAAVVAVGLLLHRAGAAAVAAGQCASVLLVLTALFTENGILGLVPGPAAMREFGALIAAAAEQVHDGAIPVQSTPEILFLVTAAFGLFAVTVHLAAVSAGAPAAAGVPLLAMFAVPAALVDDLLPWSAMAAAAAGFGVLLVARDGARRHFPGGAAIVAGAVVLALGIGAMAGFVGTAGRFTSGTGAGGSGGSIGLSPFTALRGQLDQTVPVELFRVRGLPQATYLRALTLRDYVPNSGWQATAPDPGVPLPGPITAGSGGAAGSADVEIENVSFRDYWLPLFGRPLGVSDLADGRWAYDARSGTAYTSRPRQDSWRQQAELTVPTLGQLRASRGGADGVEPPYLNVEGVDPRIGELAAQVVAGRTTAFDRALALQDYFTGPDSTFTYSFQTAPGGGDDALVEFLTIGRTGYCEQFASALAVMLRTVGVPARVAVGFTAGIESGDYRSITTADAHAWVEAWFPELGWTTFDPTPLTDGRAITPRYVLEARAEAAAKAAPRAGDLPGLNEQSTPAPGTASTAPEPPAPEKAAQATTGTAVPLWPPAVLLAVVLAALAPAGLRGRQRRRRLASVSAGGPDAASAGWAELLAESADRGAATPPNDTVRAAARRLVREHRLDPESQQALRVVVGAVEASWYDEDHSDTGTLAGPFRTVRAGIMTGSALTIRKRLLPRSVMSRLTRAEPPPES